MKVPNSFKLLSPYFLVTVIIVSFISYNAFNLLGWEKSEIEIDGEQFSENLLKPDEIYRVYDPNAKYTIVNYFSPDCKHCKQAFLEETEKLSSFHGKINLAYRYNPLSSQPLSYEKSVLLECIRLEKGQDIFFDAIQENFENFEETSASNTWYKKMLISHKYLTGEEVDGCVGQEDLVDKILKVKETNLINGITYTPTLLVFEDSKLIDKVDNISGVVVDLIHTYYLKKN